MEKEILVSSLYLQQNISGLWKLSRLRVNVQQSLAWCMNGQYRPQRSQYEKYMLNIEMNDNLTNLTIDQIWR